MQQEKEDKLAALASDYAQSRAQQASEYTITMSQLRVENDEKFGKLSNEYEAKVAARAMEYGDKLAQQTKEYEEKLVNQGREYSEKLAKLASDSEAKLAQQASLYEEQLAQLRRESAEAHGKSVGDYAAQLRDLQQKLAAMAAENQELKSNLAVANETAEKFKSERDRLFTAINGVLKEKEKLQEEIGAKDKTIKEISDKLQKLESELAALQAKLALATDSLANRDSTIAALKAGLVAKDATIDSLKSDLSKQQTANESLRNEILQLQAKLKGLEEANNTVVLPPPKPETTQAETQTDPIEEKIKIMKVYKNNNLRTDLQKLEAEREDVEVKWDGLRHYNSIGSNFLRKGREILHEIDDIGKKLDSFGVTGAVSGSSGAVPPSSSSGLSAANSSDDLVHDYDVSDLESVTHEDDNASVSDISSVVSVGERSVQLLHMKELLEKRLVDHISMLEKWNNQMNAADYVINLDSKFFILEEKFVSAESVADQLESLGGDEQLYDVNELEMENLEQKGKMALSAIVNELHSLQDEYDEQNNSLNAELVNFEEDHNRILEALDELKRKLEILEKIEMMKKANRPAYVAKQGDMIDALISQFLEKYKSDEQMHIPPNFKRISEGLYEFGTKRIRAQILNDVLVVRVGGGYMKFEEFVKKYGQSESVKIIRTPGFRAALVRSVSDHNINKTSRQNQPILIESHSGSASAPSTPNSKIPRLNTGATKIPSSPRGTPSPLTSPSNKTPLTSPRTTSTSTTPLASPRSTSSLGTPLTSPRTHATSSTSTSLSKQLSSPSLAKP